MNVEGFAAAFPERAPRLAWFFGAGASASSGIPTGYDMILDFKTRLFCAATKIPRREVDPTDPLWTDRIESYFDGAHGLPPRGSAAEYAAAFEAVHPTVEARRTYIEMAVRRGVPSYGHRVFAAFACERRIACLFTTNFDPLIENSVITADDTLDASDRVHVTVAALDSADRAHRSLREDDWPLVVKLHGDYKSDWLMNTQRELEQDTQLRQTLVATCARFGLAVIGYSGRDKSVMEALLAAAEQPGGFPGGIYWFTRPSAALLPAVTGFLTVASEHTATHLIEVENFDELAGALDGQIEHPPQLDAYVSGSRPQPLMRDVAIPTVDAAAFPVLRTSALLLTRMPKSARKLALAKPSTTAAVQQLLRVERVRSVAACQGTTVAAFGQDAHLLAALAPLGARIDGEIDLDPLADSWALGLLYEALVRALCRARPLRPRLRHRGHALVLTAPGQDRTDPSAHRDRDALRTVQRAYSDALTGTVPGVGHPFGEAVRVRLEHWLDQWWLVFDPVTWVDRPRIDRSDAGDNPDEAAAREDELLDWRRERWAQRYNAKWAKIIDSWARLLAPDDETPVHLGVAADAGVNATFSIYQKTAWSRPASPLSPGAAGRNR